MYFKTSAKGQVLTDKMENGEICCLCQYETEEEYGLPGACEACGGDFVLFREPPDPPGFEDGFCANH